jgi:hypothetical protein
MAGAPLFAALDDFNKPARTLSLDEYKERKTMRFDPTRFPEYTACVKAAGSKEGVDRCIEEERKRRLAN